MYKIFLEADGSTLGYVEQPNYIKVGESGSFAPTDAESAEGVALNSTAYSLPGHELEGAEAVGLTEFDGGAAIAQQEQIVDDLLIAELEG